MTATSTADGATRLPLSFNQEFLRMFDSGDESGPFGPRFHMVGVWRLTGPVDLDHLRGALADVVERHEPLRSQIIREADAGHQRVFPATPPRLDVRECPGVPVAERARRAQELRREIEAGTLDINELPHLRAVLLRFDARDAVLLLQTHHTATDGMSMRLLARDLAAYYTARKDGTDAGLPPVRPYHEFVAWEREQAASPATARSLDHWRQKLRGARLTALRTDHLKSAGLPSVTAAYRFTVGADLVSGALALAKDACCSPFMVLLAAYYRLVHRITGATDVVVSTHTPGRANGKFNDTVGSFFNFLPLRVDLAGCADVGELLRRTRATCLDAYAHDIPAIQLFEALPDLMSLAMRDDHAPVTFQVFPRAHALEEDEGDPDAGTPAFSEIPWQPQSAPVVSELPDGALWTLSFEPSGEAMGNLMYRTDRFDEATVVRMADDYREVLRELLAEAAAPVARAA
ncbi:condensation domain-containing protein [Streptomyces drozdowiczii]|uniref:Condensation domain-containing protein n=1 Tax=Streptomyces drozdowiczii TaxID=202862 RepID=A0ABY6Q106_9ACTN|nr:condensation domain-containing protein [Streptomyces drozdowiczii]UZK58091.1 condensation domain-containing protein [Streptomyces drozdowiczii]